MTFTIDHTKRLTLEDLERLLKEKEPKVALSEKSKKAIAHCREFLDKKITESKAPVYGVNTGFGALCDVVVAPRDLEQLQENLVKSHACGMGDEVPEEIVKLMLLLKIQSLSYGHSGVQVDTVEHLCDLLNYHIYPVVYQQGSLGASGDLAPLAHLCLPVLGLGKVNYKGSRLATSIVYDQKKLTAVRLRSKEGLALLNGTQFMSAYGAWCLIKAKYLRQAADFIASVSIDAFDARMEPFLEALHEVRPHQGQLETARTIRKHLKGSEIAARDKKQVQDPYSFRCIPQVHGASSDALDYVSAVFETEINSVTDNPIIFPVKGEILSGGNFHGQPLALGLDFLAIAIAELASISERRTYLLISGQRGLPPFLAPNPGLNSGFMIPQYTAAAIVSQNKQLCTPASVDTIMSSNGQEDHVSMGANAATKCYQVICNTERVLAIELMNAAQALEFRRPLKSSPVIEEMMTSFRKSVFMMRHDEMVHDLMSGSLQFMRSYFNQQ
jgi:histidine ammonia-lyase